MRTYNVDFKNQLYQTAPFDQILRKFDFVLSFTWYFRVKTQGLFVSEHTTIKLYSLKGPSLTISPKTD